MSHSESLQDNFVEESALGQCRRKIDLVASFSEPMDRQSAVSGHLENIFQQCNKSGLHRSLQYPMNMTALVDQVIDFTVLRKNMSDIASQMFLSDEMIDKILTTIVYEDIGVQLEAAITYSEIYEDTAALSSDQYEKIKIIFADSKYPIRQPENSAANELQ